MAHASDGLGSIRIPAACCGLVGLKVTRDRNPNGPDDGDRAIGFSVDHVVSRTVRDSAAMLDATGYAEAASPYATPAKAGLYLDEVSKSPGKLTIAWSSQTASGRPIDPEIQAAFERTVELLRGLGHEMVERSLDVNFRELYRAQARVSAANFAANIKRWVEVKGREPGDDIGPLARRAYEGGKRISGQDALWGWQQLRIMNRQIMTLFETVDVFLTPVLGTPVPKVDWLDPLMEDLREFDRRQATTFPFTPPFNFTGQPSMSLPLEQSENGLPVGMMFTSRYADEATLFRLAGQLEKERPWKDRKPRYGGDERGDRRGLVVTEPPAKTPSTPKAHLRIKFTGGALESASHILGSASASVLVAGLIGPYIAALSAPGMAPKALLGVSLLALLFSVISGIGALVLRGMGRCIDHEAHRLSTHEGQPSRGGGE